MSQIIVVGSLNPVKIEAVRLATADIYSAGVECCGVNAASDVPDQVCTCIHDKR